MYKIRRREYSSVMGYITLGYLVGQFGPLLNEATISLQLSASKMGILMTAFYSTSIIGMLMGIFFANRIGSSKFLLIGSTLLSVALFIGYICPTILGLWLYSITGGIALGIYQAGINSLAVDNMQDLPLNKRSGRMAYLQFYFGIGAVISPQFVVISSYYLNGWNATFLLTFLCGVVPLTLLIFKVSSQVSIPQKDTTLANQKIAISLPLSMLLILGLVYTCLESSTFNWLTYFWDQNFQSEKIIGGAKFMSIYWLFFSISRLTMGVLIEKLGTNKSLFYSALVSSAILVIWSLTYQSVSCSVLLLLLLALILGCMIPTMLIFINHSIPGSSSSITSLFLIFMTIGASGFPIILGKTMDNVGIHVYPVVLASLAFVSWMLIYISIQLTKSKMSDQR